MRSFIPPQTVPSRPIVRRLAILLLLAVSTLIACMSRAHPYASAVSGTNGAGMVSFIMNEGGATVYVVFNDNTTNLMGVLPAGPTNFNLGSHSSFRIICFKAGNGTPAQISSDTYTNSLWNSPRGIAVNTNPKIGGIFGRIYAGNSAGGGTIGNGFKGHGLYALNPDQTDAIGVGTQAMAVATFANSGASGPWRMSVAPDNTLLVNDFSTADAALWQFLPDLSNSNLVLSIIGQTAAAAAGIHGDMFGTPHMTGSLADGNLVLWTADSGMAVPNATIAPSIVLPPFSGDSGHATSRGDFNCIFRYDIGSGPLPWNQPPNYAYCMGLAGIGELRTEMTLGNDGKIIAGYGRANLSNPDIQILDPTGMTQLWDSWHDTGGSSDPWAGVNGSGVGGPVVGGTYNGVRVSPDGRFFASEDYGGGITLGAITNGIPDDGSIFGIANAPSYSIGSPTAPARGGMCWDAADNVYVSVTFQGLMRIYSLGITTTCVTSNDFTGTNGSFQLILPSTTASVAGSAPASQNYTNNSIPGSVISGKVSIGLSTSTLPGPVTVNFTRSGSASYPSNYTMGFNPATTGFLNADGVFISSNSVTFPAGTYPHGGNWTVDVPIVPTKDPLSGPTLTATLKLIGGSTYVAAAPLSANVPIANTGPQLLLLNAAASGATMYRGVTNDYAKFVITRWGDTNGPSNSPGSINPLLYTVTNVTYFGTAVFPTDYGARAQRIDPAGDGVIVPPTNGSSGILIHPGDIDVTCVVGNPVPHSNLSQPPTDVTIIFNLTNNAPCPGCTNLVSAENLPYMVNVTTVTATEVDNAVGPETVVLYGNPLTNALDSVNWTLTYADTNLGGIGTTVLPVVIPNYTNSNAFSVPGGGTNDFDVRFGNPIVGDGIAPSATMAAKNWSTALRMTVNKNKGFPAGVNVYPQGKSFSGNYALRFNMYLSLYDNAINTPAAASAAREFALFGINHGGTNCNWRTDRFPAVAAGTGNGTTNADGVWFAIDAGQGSISPADFDGFGTQALPNSGVPNDLVSTPASAQSGVFKHPPFDTVTGGGEPVNQWVDVSVEVTAQTNCTLYINRSAIFSFVLTNVPSGVSGQYTSGTIMLGYLDPILDISDNTAFAYFSNVRVVELSPYITNSPSSMIVLSGANINLTSGANLASPSITNVWYTGTTNGGGTPTAAVQTNSSATPFLGTSLAVNNILAGTNFMSVFSDAAGSVTSVVAVVEVVNGPANKTVNAGSNVTFSASATGDSPPTYQWRYSGTNLVNSSHYSGVGTSTLTITNAQFHDSGSYTVVVSNPSGSVSPAALLTVNVPASSITHAGISGTNIVISFTSPNPLDTAGSYILQSSLVVTGPYTNTPATITGTNPNFQVAYPHTDPARFFRLVHIN
jgi:hypothetical protein